jgi:hypothetical protein
MDEAQRGSIIVRRDEDGSLNLVGDWPDVAEVSPYIVGHAGNELRCELRFTLANAAANYLVIGWEESFGTFVVQRLAPKEPANG